MNAEPREWWQDCPDEDDGPTMKHPFSGDPWGPCSGCGHPIYHLIHRVDDESVKDEHS